MYSRRILVMSALISAVSCTKAPTVDSNDPAQALVVAKKYAETHYPAGSFQPNGARLDYFVKDMGTEWEVTLSPDGYLGGGLGVTIRKRDMKVISALRTQ